MLVENFSVSDAFVCLWFDLIKFGASGTSLEYLKKGSNKFASCTIVSAGMGNAEQQTLGK